MWSFPDFFFPIIVIFLFCLIPHQRGKECIKTTTYRNKINKKSSEKNGKIKRPIIIGSSLPIIKIWFHNWIWSNNTFNKADCVSFMLCAFVEPLSFASHVPQSIVEPQTKRSIPISVFKQRKKYFHSFLRSVCCCVNTS